MNTITVNGKGSVHVVPDVTRLEISIEQWFESYNKAYARARDNSAWLVKILEFNKQPGNLAKTIEFDISDFEEDRFDENNNFIGKVKNGFFLTQKVKIDLGIDNKLVHCIVRGIGKFVKNAQINIGYTVRDKRPYEMKMIGRAASDAREKADIMLKSLGCKVGNVVNVHYNNFGVSVFSQARYIHSSKEAMSSTSDSLDISPDDLLISDQVNVEFEIINPKDSD